jgi:RNA polymerase sigma-70 factor (family 1)
MNDIKKILIRIAENNDQKAFKVFFQHYYVRLIKLALLYVPMQEQAEEIVSEVLIKLLKQRQKLFRIENFEGYLFFAVKNQSISFIRKQKVQYNFKSLDFETDIVINDNDPEKSLELNELADLISVAINKLPPRRQMIFKLVKEEKQKIKEVASLLDIAPKTVENHLDMAMKELRTAVKNYFDDRASNTTIVKMVKIISLLFTFTFIL